MPGKRKAGNKKSGKLLYLSGKGNEMKKNLVILSGAGISAESGIKTFRESGGVWEQYEISRVASPEAWAENPSMVLRFYNERRKQVLKAKPNGAHLGLKELENDFEVWIITQNIDDLYEKARSTKVLHLHGEIRKARSTADPSLIYEWEGGELNPGDRCEKHSQLRPHVVWFGEPVTEFPRAVEMTALADIFVVIGTSLNVYPAAGLLQHVSPVVPVFLINPDEPGFPLKKNHTHIRENAVAGVSSLIQILRKIK